MIYDNCRLTTLDVSKNTNLKRISCCQNQLTTLQVAAAKAKGWIVAKWDGGENFVDYAGITPGDANSDGVVNVADIVAVARHQTPDGLGRDGLQHPRRRHER